jgi:glutamyl-tRNA synthetase
MLAMLGWNPGTTQEIFSMDELAQAFTFERVNKSGAKFDPDKTKWFNQQYLRKKSDAELADLFLPIIKEKGFSPDKKFVEGVCRLVKEKSHFVNEFWDGGSYFFVAPTTYDSEVIKKRWNEQSANFIKETLEAFKGLESFTAAETESTFKATAEKLGIGAGQVMQLFRVTLSGVGGGPALFEIVELLGKDEVVKRLELAIKTIK